MSSQKTGAVTHPELLIDQIVRNRIFANTYWKEECHALNGIFHRFYYKRGNFN